MRRQDKELERRFFDRRGGEAEYDVLAPRAYRRLLAELEPLRAGRERGLQLDLGAGTGAFTRHLARAGWRTVAADLSRVCLRRLRADQPGVDAVQADLERLPFRDGAADLVVFSGVLHHLPDLGAAAAEAMRVLRPGGCGFSYDPHERHPAMWLCRSASSPLARGEGRTANERNLTRGELERALRGAGFAGVEVASVSGICFREVAGRGRASLLLYNLLERALEASGLERWWGSFLIARFRKP